MLKRPRALVLPSRARCERALSACQPASLPSSQPTRQPASRPNQQMGKLSRVQLGLMMIMIDSGPLHHLARSRGDASFWQNHHFELVVQSREAGNWAQLEASESSQLISSSIRGLCPSHAGRKASNVPEIASCNKESNKQMALDRATRPSARAKQSN